jgi:hypothetical protein
MTSGWQLINGVWHQVVLQKRYSFKTYRDELTETVLPEPEIDLGDISAIGRFRGKGKRRFSPWTFVRYW